jgi:GDPmannose 4,6-dehydratase
MQWLMLQQDIPEDFVIATGIQFSVREFVDLAASKLNINIRWEGVGLEEKGYDSSGKCIISVDARYFRPSEVETLLGDSTKARTKLGWVPMISFDQLVEEMIFGDLKVAERDELVKKNGHDIQSYHE